MWIICFSSFDTCVTINVWPSSGVCLYILLYSLSSIIFFFDGNVTIYISEDFHCGRKQLFFAGKAASLYGLAIVFYGPFSLLVSLAGASTAPRVWVASLLRILGVNTLTW